MNFPSNVYVVWFCRSTHPFQTFLVSINGQHGWFWPTLLHYPEILQTTLSLYRNGIEHVNILEFFHAHAYLSQVRIKCDTLWWLVSKSTRLLAAYFTTHGFHLDSPFTRLPHLHSILNMQEIFGEVPCYSKTRFYNKIWCSMLYKIKFLLIFNSIEQEKIKMF